ncbi:MAG: DUF3108 domain-containing protein [Cystobacterineae bacterium]|nr:DUF3108 domain-containing protein [Cystobacterineae bacterium]
MSVRKTFCIGLCLAMQAWATQSTPFAPGETSSYEVSYFGIPMGEAQIKVGAALQQAEQRVWPVIFIGRTKPFQPYQINDKLVTYWNPETKKSTGIDLFIDENKKRRREKIKLNHQSNTAFVTRQKEGESPNSTRYTINPETTEVAAAALFLRHQALHKGQTFELPIFTGRKNFNLKIRVAQKQQLQTRLGTMEAVLILARPEFDGSLAPKRDIRIFVSADERHIPLLIEADLVLGKLVVEIVRYVPGEPPT